MNLEMADHGWVASTSRLAATGCNAATSRFPEAESASARSCCAAFKARTIGLRTLRRGFLYVLLDQQVWHAYAVSEQGHLRRFNPYEPPDGPPSPLPEKCVNADHDIPSAFLNLDTGRYTSAWLACTIKSSGAISRWPRLWKIPFICDM